MGNKNKEVRGEKGLIDMKDRQEKERKFDYFCFLIPLKMTYVTIDTKTAQAKKLVELIETLPFAKILKEPNTVTKKAIDDVKKGKTTKHKNAKELIAFLNK
jgi:hypothetical protein